MLERKIIYIAGKITGDSNYKEKFKEAELEIQFINQVETTKAPGFSGGIMGDYKCYKLVFLNPTILPEGLDHEQYMQICYSMIDCADIVYFLPDWKESKGAQAEMEYVEKWNDERMRIAHKEIRYL